MNVAYCIEADWHCLKVRWFYKREVDRDWIPFMGYDSLRLELRYRHIWQTKWGTGAGSVAANQVLILFILLLLFIQLIISIVVKQGQYY